MKKKLIMLLLAIFSMHTIAAAQEIVNVVLVGENGVTDDIKKATSFIIVKKYRGDIYERLDYKKSAPLVKLRTYNDSTLTTQDGVMYEYYPSGMIHIKGNYVNNYKEGDWNYYDEAGKLTLTEKYGQNILIESKVPDTAQKKDSVIYGDEREADFKGGTKAFIKYLTRNINGSVADGTRGGMVLVYFMVNTLGNTAAIYLKKSVEFILDEEALRVIRQSPAWIPAFQNGKPVNAYRIQPITFAKPE